MSRLPWTRGFTIGLGQPKINHLEDDMTTVIIDKLAKKDLIKLDFGTLGKTQLVQAYNRLSSMEGNGAHPIKAFRDRASGERRCQEVATRLEARVKDDSNPATHPAGAPAGDKAAEEAKKKAEAEAAAAAKKAAAEAAKANRPPTLHQLTEAFNALVPEATKLGIAWAKEHTSDFADRTGAEKQTNRLKEAIAEAKNPKKAAA